MYNGNYIALQIQNIVVDLVLIGHRERSPLVIVGKVQWFTSPRFGVPVYHPDNVVVGGAPNSLAGPQPVCIVIIAEALLPGKRPGLPIIVIQRISDIIIAQAVPVPFSGGDYCFF